MKNFVKLIGQIHENRYSKVLKNIIENKIPVAFLSSNPLAQAVEIAKNFRAQALNIKTLIVVDLKSPPPVNLDFEIVNVNAIDKFYPKPEYIFVMGNKDLKFAEQAVPNAKIIWSPYANTDDAYEMFMSHLPELQEVYESLIDEDSKKTFCGYWLGNISNILGEIFYANTSQYICAGFIPNAGDVFIDCGSCDGNTAARFAKMGCKVYSFELDKVNYELGRKLAKEYKFILENLALGAYKHEITYRRVQGNNGISRQDFEGSEKALCTSLDFYVREKNLPRVDFIKMDVEGAELDVLKGAANTIARYKPILALSVYHKWDDFWTLMNFVKSIRPDYEFAMRQYKFFHEDDPILFDEGLVDFLESFGFDVKMSTPGECILFAR